MKRAIRKIVILLFVVGMYIAFLCLKTWLETKIGTMTTEIISNVYPVIAGAVIGIELTNLAEIVRARKSTFSGYYRDEIFSPNPEEQNNIIKRDAFCLYEKENRVFSGEFFRYFPYHSKLANWQCSGFIVADQLLLAYRAEKETTPSRGVILLKQDTERKDGLIPRFSGSYFKFEGDRIIVHRINLIQIDKKEYKAITSNKQ